MMMDILDLSDCSMKNADIERLQENSVIAHIWQ